MARAYGKNDEGPVKRVKIGWSHARVGENEGGRDMRTHTHGAFDRLGTLGYTPPASDGFAVRAASRAGWPRARR